MPRVLRLDIYGATLTPGRRIPHTHLLNDLVILNHPCGNHFYRPAISAGRRSERSLKEGRSVRTAITVVSLTHWHRNPLRGSNYAVHFNIHCNEDNLETTEVDTIRLTEEYPLKVLCVACQVSGTISFKENNIGADCVWCGKRDTLAYLDPWTQDPRNDPQPLMPFGALTTLSQPPSYIFRIQADLKDYRECTRCHRHLKQDYHKCIRCQLPQCDTHSCTFLHNQWCGGAFSMDELWKGAKAQECVDGTPSKWAWALWPRGASQA